MTFYWGTTVTLLFDNWHVTTWKGYSLTLVACFVACILHEWLGTKKNVFVKMAEKANKAAASSNDTSNQSPLLGEGGGRWGDAVTFTGASVFINILEAILYGVKVGLGYMIMLAVMSFNGGVFLVICVGMSFGFFLFRCNELGDDEDTFPDPCCPT
jgi:copper transporter 1